MNIRNALLEVHSKAQAMKVANYVGDNPERFNELMKNMLGPVYRITQRASWPVSRCIERHPELVKPYFGNLINQLEHDDVHVVVRRNVVRLLQFVDIPLRFRGRVFDACFNLLDDLSQPIAVRVFAMTVAARIARDEPDLLNELRMTIKKYFSQGSAGYRSRASKF